MRKLSVLAVSMILVACGGSGDQDAASAGDQDAIAGRRCGGITGQKCSVDEYCDIGIGQCKVADAGGICKKRPDVCPMTLVYAPVCGCDGKTYSSACEAARAGVPVDHNGRCIVIEGKRCGGLTGGVCPRGEYCQLPTGACNTADMPGVCQAMPQVCLDVVIPVCGCDRQTYNNACQAAAVGENLDHAGACYRIQ
jgi:hypothetical protein